MKMCDDAVGVLTAGRSYTRREIMSAFSADTQLLNEGSFHWKLGELLKEGKLVRNGYDSYSVPCRAEAVNYEPQYSEPALKIIELLSDTYPHVQFTVFETVLMNEFLNHLIAQNTIIVQAEKESATFLFRTLQETGYTDVMYKPSEKERTLHWKKDCIIVTDMISEAPLSHQQIHHILLEKMLVDMYCDRFITWAYSVSEFPDILSQVLKTYKLDCTKMLRYARRRNREKELKELLEEITGAKEDARVITG